MNILSRFHRAGGFALIFAVWVMAILMVIVTAFAWNQTNEVKISQTMIDTISARYLAEAGIERAIAIIKADYTNDSPARRAWVSTNRDFGIGSFWACLGKWDGPNAYSATSYQNGNLLLTWPGTSESLRYFLPSENTAFTANVDIGFYQVAVEDESGKINVNSDPSGAFTAAMKDAQIDAGAYNAGSGAAIAGATKHIRSISELGLLSGIAYTTTFEERSFLTVYPNFGTIGANTYDVSGAINVNSAYFYNNKGPLIGIPLSGGTYTSAAQAATISANRTTDPYDNLAEFQSENSLVVLEASRVRFDSSGYYRIIARGVVLAGDGTTVRAEANVECYIKATFAYDNDPVKIIYWQEWWAIP